MSTPNERAIADALIGVLTRTNGDDFDSDIVEPKDALDGHGTEFELTTPVGRFRFNVLEIKP